MTITPVTSSQFAAMVAKLTTTHQATISYTDHTAISQTQGFITGHGVTATFAYDAAAQTLNVDIVHHPFFIPVSAIESQLRAAATASA